MAPSKAPTAAPTSCYKWVLGYSTESCSLTCTRVGGSCQAQYFGDIITQNAFYTMVSSAVALGQYAAPGSATLFCDMGINVYTFASAPAAFTYQVYTTAGLSYQTFCNYPVSLALLSTTCDAQYSYPPSRRFCPCAMSSCAPANPVVELPIADPTATPTLVPTAGPTLAFVDCTTSCTFFPNTPTPLTCGNLYKVVQVTTNFQLQFDYKNPTIRSYPVISNILDLVDTITGESLLSISLPWSTSTVLGYKGTIIDAWGPNLDCQYQTTYTTITVVVQTGFVSITSSANPNWIDTIAIPVNVDTTGRQYNLFINRGTVDATNNCALGTIKNLKITGTNTGTVVTMPTTDCTSYCSFLTGGASLNVKANQTHAIVSMCTNFKIQFDYVNPTIGSCPTISNILDLQDTVTGRSLLYVSVPWTTNTVVGYNGQQVEQYGPNLVSGCDNSWTRITVIYKNGIVTITSSANPGWIDTKCVSPTFDTTNRLFYLYLSNPSTLGPSARGSIKNIAITCMNTVVASPTLAPVAIVTTSKPSVAPTRGPTRAPTNIVPTNAVPSRTPTKGPSAAPTAAPSTTRSPTNGVVPTSGGVIGAGGIDCTVGCAFYVNNPTLVTAGLLVAQIQISTYFKVQFEYRGSILGLYPFMSNIFDIQDAVTGQSLVYLSMPWAAQLSLGYNADMLNQWGPNLISGWQSIYTTITIVVQNGVISITSSNDPNWIDSTNVINVDTTGRLYNLYCSNPDVGLFARSANGWIRNLYITGSRTVTTVSMASTDCTVACSFLTSSTFDIAANQTFAVVQLTTYFTLSFEYKNPTIGAYPAISNIFDLIDASTGSSLLSVSVPWGNGIAVGYNAEQIELWGPTLVSNYQSTYTTITIVVAAGKVTITSSSNPSWFDIKYVSANVITTSSLYYLYLSNPNQDFLNPAMNEYHPSACGTIRNIQFIGSATSVAPTRAPTSLVAGPTRTPTRAPSAKPTPTATNPPLAIQSPTGAPVSAAPTNAVVPTNPGGAEGVVDCTVACTFASGVGSSVSLGNLVAVVQVSMYFKIEFEYSGPLLQLYPFIHNIFDLVDTTSGQSLIALGLPWTLSTHLQYNGAVVEAWGPGLIGLTQWTRITIVVQAGVMSISSSASPLWIDTILLSSNVDTAGRFYNLYLSNQYSDSTRRCAGGMVRNFIISGSRTIVTTPIPSTDCTTFCSFLSAGASLDVLAGQSFALISLSSYFKIQFEYFNPVIGLYPTISNILDLQDASTGQSLLYVSLPWTSATVVGYNGQLIESFGPGLVSNYLSVYTTITIVVQSGVVTITSSANPSWTDVKYVTNIDTSNKLFYLYLSNPNLDFNHPAQNENRPSACGTIRNIVITGPNTPIAPPTTAPPSRAPTRAPTVLVVPTNKPIASPTNAPVLLTNAPVVAPTAAPTFLPTVAMTAKPTTAAPTTVVTLAPTESNVVDCTQSCTFLTDGPQQVVANTILAEISMTTFFKIQFDIINPFINVFPFISNILDIRDSVTDQSLLCVSMPWGNALQVSYNGYEGIQWGPGLILGLLNVYTTVTITVTSGIVTIVSSSNPSWIASYSITNFATNGRTYNLYMSNAYVGANYLCAGGYVKNFYITGTASGPSIGPSTAITTNCRVSCSLITGNAWAITANTAYAKISITTYFRMQFEVLNPTIQNYPFVSNILDLVDTVTGKSLVTVSMPWGNALSLGYNDIELSQWGPGLVGSYQSSWTTIFVTVSANQVSITSSGNSGWVNSLYVNFNPDTTNRLYYLYLSNPNDGSNFVSSGGMVRNVYFWGTGLPEPTTAPTIYPTRAPVTPPPSAKPTTAPPTRVPTREPTFQPSTARPSVKPTIPPPTAAPTTTAPTFRPTLQPTGAPATVAPSRAPTSTSPSRAPTFAPTLKPTFTNTQAPSRAPTFAPTRLPSFAPTRLPSAAPTAAPTGCTRWVLGYSAESCTTTCGRLSGQCIASNLNSIVTQDSFYAMVSAALVLGQAGVSVDAASFCNLGVNVYVFAPAPAAFTYQVFEAGGMSAQTYCNYPTSLASLVSTCDTAYAYPPSRRFCSCSIPNCSNLSGYRRLEEGVEEVNYNENSQFEEAEEELTEETPESADSQMGADQSASTDATTFKKIPGEWYALYQKYSLSLADWLSQNINKVGSINNSPLWASLTAACTSALDRVMAAWAKIPPEYATSLLVAGIALVLTLLSNLAFNVYARRRGAQHDNNKDVVQLNHIVVQKYAKTKKQIPQRKVLSPRSNAAARSSSPPLDRSVLPSPAPSPARPIRQPPVVEK